jgi:hypothetical protein
MTKLAVPTEDLAYCRPEDARLYAVEALFVAASRGEHFYDIYFALISYHLGYWIDDHFDEIDGEAKAELLMLYQKSEKFRAFLDQDQNKPMRILRDEVLPLGCILYNIFRGSTKEEAMKETRKMLLHKYKPPETSGTIPSSSRHLSKKTQERLWQKYSEVLHYVWLTNLDNIHRATGLEPVSYFDGRKCWGQIVSAFETVSRTKKMKVQEPVFLKFMTCGQFSEYIKKNPSRS